MSENCNHDCGSCASNCSSRQNPESFLIQPNQSSHIKKVIGIVSGKGGVGKSLVSSLLAVQMQKKGFQCGILDADITGPSIPKVFGISGQALGNEKAIAPATTSTGIRIMSINLLLDTQQTPVIWRGPVIAGMVKQFYTDVLWEDLDYLFVDMPPGTGDVPLTVFQSLPVDGIIIVTSPQELVSMIVSKAINMAAMMNIDVLGIVENMSYLQCPDCAKKIEIFGQSHLDEIAKEKHLDILARIPLNPEIAKLCDEGKIESCEDNSLAQAVQKLRDMTK